MDTAAEILMSIDMGIMPTQISVDWAISEIKNGCELESVNDLAWLASPSKEEALSLMSVALTDLGYLIPQGEEYLFSCAYYIAKEILNDSIGANKGCSIIGEINEKLGWPEKLSTFGALAHEQTGHDQFGITSNSLKAYIYEAAIKLVYEE